MSLFFYTIIFIIGLILYRSYTNIISNKNFLDAAYANVDVQLKKRYDLIPNILTIAKKYMEYEKNVLLDITNIRTKLEKNYKESDDNKNIKERFKLEDQLDLKMKELNISLENYPDLYSHKLLIEAQQSYSEVERNISAARRNYNQSIAYLKNSIEIYPGKFINDAFLKVKSKPMFEIKDEEKKEIKAEDYL
ncbi:LemA family protein [Arcobacter sp. CECT 8985]|uniref:LemA family protein n=1 Tax=Arcobacter sp. CECT 8985 TaxID=1935424 RepID=UPI00100BFFA6|nr:LemA family protein [Arcobacter sp. CECT 8985]RXJ87742.1 LemA family protein [Arcobacter sp. CECT 8985]